MRCQSRSSRRRGAVAPFIALCSLVLLGVMALSLDGGLLMYERQRTRTAADAAALAAAQQLFLHYPTNAGLDLDGSAKQAALAVAAAAGYTNDSVNSVVTVNTPPQSGPFAGTTGYTEIILQLNQPRCFSAIWGSSSLTVTARSVARGLWAPFNNGIILLDPTMPSALALSGGGTVTVQNSSVIVDSNNSEAAYSGGGSIAAANEFDVVGGYGVSNGGSFVGPVYTDSIPAPDPLAYLPEPDPTTLTLQSTKKINITGGNVTLSPGVYEGGIAISGNANVTLSPGIYYMGGGGFSFGGGGSVGGTLTGSGVMIYNAPSSKSNSDVISIKGNSSSSISLSPPTSGLYQGISLFQERTANQPINITGNGSFTVTGTFYGAAANLSVAGNGVNNIIGSQYISDSLTTSGGGSYYVAWDANKSARKRIIGLVE